MKPQSTENSIAPEKTDCATQPEPDTLEAVLLSPPYSVLTYKPIPGFSRAFWQPGLRLAVPLGRGTRSAILLGFSAKSLEDPGYTLKEIAWPLENTPLLRPDYLELARQFALRQALPLGRVLCGMLPAGLRTTDLPLRFCPPRRGLQVDENTKPTAATTAAHTPKTDRRDADILNATIPNICKDSGAPLDFALRQMSALSRDLRACLAVLWENNQGRVIKNSDKADQELYSLTVSPPWPVRPSAVKQLRLLDFMTCAVLVSKRRILKELGPDFAPSLKQLLAKGLLKSRTEFAATELERLESHTMFATTEPGSSACSASSGGLVSAIDLGSADGSGGLINQNYTASSSGNAQREHLDQQTRWLKKHGPALHTPPPFLLNTEQQTALDDLCAALHETKPATRLLYGITGSGKTAVYLEFAAKTLLGGKSVLILAPEVALALKLRHDAAERFPGLPVRLFHGYQPQAAREACFRELAFKCAPGQPESEPVLVVGTRSALFLQLPKLGAIILDEEHDSSFKQDERIVYQAKDLAWYRAGQSGAVLVLGSATPDLKTFYAAEQGHIRLHRLAGRVGGGSLPEITLSSMLSSAQGARLSSAQGAGLSSTQAASRASGAHGILTEESAKALQACVARGEQAVILLNRRGYAPTMFCLSCGTAARCPHCEVSLTYHKKREKLICHYCGYTAPFPSPCPVCKSTHFLPLGEGTEKLEERLQNLLPTGTRILRLDRDSTGKPGSLEEILRSFGRGEADVLVGTQMLSKGHHFPRVTLAIVADGDMGLGLPDYNAAERTFQMLLQTAGRAGRSGNGQVIIQTRNLDHYCWTYVASSDYEGFYRQELQRRERRQYPPFVRLALARISFPLGWAEGQALVAEIGKIMKSEGSAAKVTVLGPAPAPYQMRERRLRFQCLLKGSNWQDIRAVYAKAAAAVNGKSRQNGFALSLDLDPVSMM